MTDYTNFLKSWANNHAALSMGRVCADRLYEAALDAHLAGKDLNDPIVRRAVIEASAALPGPSTKH
jgi:hypothetical protein